MTELTDTQQDEASDEELSRAKRLVDGELLRMYSDGDNSWPSVSTVLDSRPTPEKTSLCRDGGIGSRANPTVQIQARYCDTKAAAVH
jgi:hypothetical protein